jgi:SAM-dependent methyltransferase
MTREEMAALFGRNVPDWVQAHARAAPRGAALDIGCASGATVRWLAALGFDSTGIDRSLPAELEEAPGARFLCRDILDFPLGAGHYSLVIALNVLQFLKPSDKSQVLDSVVNGLREGGVVIVQSFTTEDPAFVRLRQQAAPIEPNCFWSEPLQSAFSFFEPGELRAWARTRPLDLLLYEEKVYDDDHPPYGKHQHGMVSIVGNKRVSSPSLSCCLLGENAELGGRTPWRRRRRGQ